MPSTDRAPQQRGRAARRSRWEADVARLDKAGWPFAPPPGTKEHEATAEPRSAWPSGFGPRASGPPRRYGPPRSLTLWLPVAVAFLVQVIPAVVAYNRTGRTSAGLLVILFAVIGPLALIAARRFPGPVVVVAATVACADLLLTPGSGAPYLALAFAIVSAMVRSARNWAIASVAAGWVVALVGAILLGIDWHPFRIIATSLGILLVVMVGEGIRTRSQRLAQFQAAVHKRREDAAQAERERIARELHDVLAHSLSQINVQAGMGLHLIDSHPEKAREALGNIKATSKTALDEVRGVLGFLRAEGADAGGSAVHDAPTLFDYSTFPGEPGFVGDAGGAGERTGAGRRADSARFAGPAQDAPLVPQADLSRLPALVASITTSELHVELENRLVDEPPPGIQLALFRITQESLTNVSRHAEASEARVVLECAGDDYVLRVSDNGRSKPPTRPSAERASGGRGLLGMKERAELLGGRLEAGPVGGGGFAVVATVPRVPRRSRP